MTVSDHEVDAPMYRALVDELAFDPHESAERVFAGFALPPEPSIVEDDGSQ